MQRGGGPIVRAGQANDRKAAGRGSVALRACEKVPEGCGRAPACPDCPVRKAVQAASRGRRVTRQKAQMELAAGGKTTKVDLQISCSAFTYERSKFILLVLEGLHG